MTDSSDSYTFETTLSLQYTVRLDSDGDLELHYTPPGTAEDLTCYLEVEDHYGRCILRDILNRLINADS